MRKLYREQYLKRYEVISDLIASNDSILELCPGDGYLFEFYLSKSNPHYTGIEWNPKFCKYLRKLGMEVINDDVLYTNFPAADVVLIHASLYQFHENQDKLISKIFAAAKKMVIVVEPVENVAASSNKLKAKIAAHLTNPGDGPKEFRYSQSSLLEAFKFFPKPEIHFKKGDKEMILVFNLKE